MDDPIEVNSDEVVASLHREAAEVDVRATRAEILFSLNYLTAFGYLAKTAWNNKFLVLQALQSFQHWFGSKEAGVVGPLTLKAMQESRCGCPDFIDANEPAHIPYVQMVNTTEKQMTRWGRQGLTYCVESYVPGPSAEEQLQIFAGAWKAWSDVCGISVRRVISADKADLVIATGEGPRSFFDGEGGTLAWANVPSTTNSMQQLVMKFDLGETWSVNPKTRGVLLFNVACHEFGHMLGLQHSKCPGALMSPYYNPATAVPQWNDDIMRVQSLYGQNSLLPTNSQERVFIIRGTNIQIEEQT